MKFKRLKSIAMKSLQEPTTVSKGIIFTAATQQQINNSTIDIGALKIRVTELEEKLLSITNLFNIVYNSDNSIASETYTTHTHSYTDAIISDTSDGTGITITTDKTTSGID